MSQAYEWADWEAWVASRPASVRALIERFPPMTTVMREDKLYYVFGYTECGMLIASEVNPCVDYATARATQIYICAAHLVRLQ